MFHAAVQSKKRGGMEIKNVDLNSGSDTCLLHPLGRVIQSLLIRGFSHV